MPRRTWACALIAVVSMAGCTTSSAITPRSSPQMRLVAFDSCDQLHRELRLAAQQSVTPYGLPGTASYPVPEMARARGIPNAAAVGAEAAPAAPDHSGTNVQEAGADEPDLVKTDGRRIVTVTGGVLRVIDPATRSQTGRLDLKAETGTAQVLLAGDRALVLITDPGYPMRGRGLARPFGGQSQVLLVDLTGPPKVLSRYRSDSTLIDARQTGNLARVVLSSRPQINFPQDFRQDSDEAALRANRQAIGAAPVEAWLPTWEVTTGGATAQGRLDCSAVSRPKSFSGASLVRVLTFDLTAAALDDGAPVAVAADGDTVYATGTSLYLANDPKWQFGLTQKAADTDIFQFDLPSTGKPRFVAAGAVPGTLVNQYAMSEWDGHLRVATTDPAADASAVRVLRTSGDRLVQVGEVDGLGRGEKIYSVRFIGARGYVVTFRQTDPLYSLDLADPTHPQVTGELKITGYSAHLQPVGDDRLIGIGQEANTEGQVSGTQISLFDVSDPATPKRLDQHMIAGGATSEAEFDPHALLWWPASGLLVVPLDTARPLALKVTNNALQAPTQLAAPEGQRDPVRRSLVVGEVLWTVSESGLTASNLSTLDKLAWVPLT
ncbi:MAG: beta-propeller domain-containing protein [Actinoplanes sp.]